MTPKGTTMDRYHQQKCLGMQKRESALTDWKVISSKIKHLALMQGKDRRGNCDGRRKQRPAPLAYLVAGEHGLGG